MKIIHATMNKVRMNNE